jgi:hypothetical protein
LAAGASLTGSVGVGLQGTIAYETSVMRANTLSAEVAAVSMATQSGDKKGWDVKRGEKKIIWSGKYTQ